MPRQRFLGQSLVDFLLAHGLKICDDPEGPPAGLTVLSRDCADADAAIYLVAHTVVQGAPYAERLLDRIGIAIDELWEYLGATD